MTNAFVIFICFVFQVVTHISICAPVPSKSSDNVELAMEYLLAHPPSSPGTLGKFILG